LVMDLLSAGSTHCRHAASRGIDFSTFCHDPELPLLFLTAVCRG